MLVKQENDFVPILAPAGNHYATCYSVVGLGLQETNWLGQIKLQQKVRIAWELPLEIIEDGEFTGEPFSVSKIYTLSLNDKSNLYKDLISWRGRAFSQKELEGFELFSIANVNCMLNVIHNKSEDGFKTYANVSSISQLPKGTEKMPAKNPVVTFDTNNYTQEQFKELPEWLQNKINLPEPEHNTAAHPEDDNCDSFDDDIPF